MTEPGVLRAREPRVAAGLELAVLGTAHAIDALVEVLGAVEAIEHDLPVGVGHLGARVACTYGSHMSMAIASTCARCAAVSPKAQKASRLSRLRSSATNSTRAPSRSLTTVT